MILVFGKTGQVATELARHPDVRCLGRDQADLTSPERCVEAIESIQPEAIINAAAYTAVDRAEDEEALATAVNSAAPKAIAEAAAKLGLPFVHISSDYVFDGTGEAPYKPTNATAPLGAYGRSKLAGERAVVAAGGSSVVLRTSWVFSAQGSNFLKTMLRMSETHNRLTIVSDQIGGPTPASAIAKACIAIIERLRAGEATLGIHHFAGAPDVSWADFAREIFLLADRKIDVIDISSAEYPTPAARPLNSRLDCTSLRAAFGIERPDWREGVQRILGELA